MLVDAAIKPSAAIGSRVCPPLLRHLADVVPDVLTATAENPAVSAAVATRRTTSGSREIVRAPGISLLILQREPAHSDDQYWVVPRSTAIDAAVTWAGVVARGPAATVAATSSGWSPCRAGTPAIVCCSAGLDSRSRHRAIMSPLPIGDDRPGCTVLTRIECFAEFGGETARQADDGVLAGGVVGS